MTKKHSLTMLMMALALPASSLHAAVIYSDNFDDNTNTGWTYLDRSGGTAINTTTGGGPGSPSFSEQNGELQQTATNYSFPNPASGPQLGGIALSGSGSVSGSYTISVTMESLEPGNGFQDQVVVFGYVDEDNFHYVETIADGNANLFSIDAGTRTLIGSTGITFNHNPTMVDVIVDTTSGDVSINYGGAGITSLATGQTIAAGLNGIGSNNDAWAIDNYSIDQTPIPEPGSLVLLGLSGLTILRRRR